MKLMHIAGARPQFIKLAALYREISFHSGIQQSILHTGQHWSDNMSAVFFRELDIPAPDFQLEVHGLPHGAMTGRMLERIEKILLEERPDTVLVYGDTNSTLAGALAARKLNIRLAHAEAGMRCDDPDLPEEVNRVITDRISNLLFCPTLGAKDNLEKEGFKDRKAQVFLTGDLMWDALDHYSSRLGDELPAGVPKSPFALFTLHREENTIHQDRLASIISILSQIHQQLPVVFPAHPRTAGAIKALNMKIPFPVLDPFGYLDMLRLIKQCRIVLTDSGGLQKEAYYFHKPCVVLRNHTEWSELESSGTNIPAGSDPSRILDAFNKLSKGRLSFKEPYYGDGHAARKMAEALLGKNPSNL